MGYFGFAPSLVRTLRALSARPNVFPTHLLVTQRTNSPGASLDRRRLARRANLRDGVSTSNSPAGRDPLKNNALPEAASLFQPTSEMKTALLDVSNCRI
ncbi:protein of unknown function [Methylocaldum szegediense]|uniref:Uncharacterized protein n=1 Tax=Methylocaldum szegediense TaxID=73780 RepID=A0ABM9I4Z2_9GAMM|nr:protein of unknown function [Methylocaldum szegediense]